MSDTPRTDIAAHPDRPFSETMTVPADFARELERENAKLREDKARLDLLATQLRAQWVERAEGFIAKWRAK